MINQLEFDFQNRLLPNFSNQFIFVISLLGHDQFKIKLMEKLNFASIKS